MSIARSLIAPTSNVLLERALRDKLGRRGETAGSLGELEPLAMRLGLIQNTLKPRLRDPHLVVFAAYAIIQPGDAGHGIQLDGRSSTTIGTERRMTSSDWSPMAAS